MYVASNKGADQTAWMRRLICAFVVRIMARLATSRLTIFGEKKHLILIISSFHLISQLS